MNGQKNNDSDLHLYMSEYLSLLGEEIDNLESDEIGI